MQTKKAFLTIIIFFICTVFLAAEPADKRGHNIFFGISTGFLFGHSEEIVFVDNRSPDKWSLLTWEIKPLFYIGLDLRYTRYENNFGFFANVSGRFGLPGKTGLHENRDWFEMSGNIAVPTYPNLTHYSVHDNHTKTAILLDADIGVSFRINDRLRLKPFISYSMMYFSWEGVGGTFFYPDWHGGHFTRPSWEIGITYRQLWHIISPGLSLYGELNGLFSMELFFRASPLVWLFAVDEHLLREGYDVPYLFYDRAFGGIMLEPGLQFSFKPNPFFALSFFYSFRNISEMRGLGVSFTRDYRRGTHIAGGAYSVHTFGIAARARYDFSRRLR